MTTIDSQGYLSKDAIEFVEVVRSSFSELIERFKDLSARATRQLFEGAHIQDSDSDWLAVRFWSICLSNCQAAFLLAERGAGREALIIMRTALENFFFCVALIKNPEFIQRLPAGPHKEMLKQAKEMLKCDDKLLANCPEDPQKLSKQNRQQLEKAIADMELLEIKGEVNVYDAAATADLESLYQSKYRILSLSAVHASLIPVLEKSYSNVIAFGPALDEVEEVFVSGIELLEMGVIYIAGPDQKSQA